MDSPTIDEAALMNPNVEAATRRLELMRPSSQRIVLPYKPRHPQTIIHPQLNRHRFNVLVCHRRMGKTVLGINHAIKKASTNKLWEPRYAFIAPFRNQAKTIAWSYCKRYTAPIPGIKYNESDLGVTLPGGATLRLFGADNPDALRGGYWDGVILDEYAQMKPDFFNEVIYPALMDRKGWCIFMGTPKGQNQFLTVYEQALKAMADGDPDWWSAVYRADETGVFTPEELAAAQRVMPDASYRQEYLCDFTASADNILITIDLATMAAARILTPADIAGAPRIIGVDPARFGSDDFIITRRQGLQVFTPLVLKNIDNMTGASRVIQEIDDFKADACFVDVGGGTGVIDRCRQLGYHVIEVNFGGRALEPNLYVNKRTEMWIQTKAWLEAGGAIPNVPEMKADLVTPTYDFDAAGRMRLESKDSIKLRLGRSPDYADSIALTFAAPVRPNTNLRAAQATTYRTDYDVLKSASYNTDYDVLK